MTESPSPFLTVEDVAKRWRTSVKAVYSLRARRDGPRATRLGRELRFSLEDVIAFERARREPEPGRRPGPLPQRQRESLVRTVS